MNEKIRRMCWPTFIQCSINKLSNMHLVCRCFIWLTFFDNVKCESFLTYVSVCLRSSWIQHQRNFKWKLQHNCFEIFALKHNLSEMWFQRYSKLSQNKCYSKRLTSGKYLSKMITFWSVKLNEINICLFFKLKWVEWM